MRWQFWIDRGGTFTDCLGKDPHSGHIKVAKVLSSDRAPLTGIRQLLHLNDDEPIPPCDVRMGTTLATNALLERHGTPCALVITRGFRDLLEIGSQARPQLFELDIRKPERLYQGIIEVDARCDANGQVIAQPHWEALTGELQRVRAGGIDSLAVVLLHAYRAPGLEKAIGKLARQVGFRHVSLSAEVAAEIGLVGRGDTTVVDAYLTPLIHDYVTALLAEMPGSTLRLMQSSGGLTEAHHFRGRNAIFSGPAAGVVAYAHVAKENDYERAIGFDMGGTSTDVSCYENEFEREYETEVAGVRLRAPMIAIKTVAAGGGSICRHNGFRFTVGPESAGADPGPLCYGRGGASELTLTDVTLALGRVAPDRFPFPLRRKSVDQALAEFADTLAKQNLARTPREIAAGLFYIANANMAEAIRQVSVAKGRDARDYALVVFGGAGGQHACPIARRLGIRTLIFDAYAGVLSAYGMGLADVSWHGEADAGWRVLDENTMGQLKPEYDTLSARGRQRLRSEGFSDANIIVRHRIDLRYRGTETAMTLEAGHDDITALREEFDAAHRRLFGYARPEFPIEAVAVRVEVVGHAPSLIKGRPTVAVFDNATAPVPQPLRRERMWSGSQMELAPLFRREDLAPGTRLLGPALILESTGTIALDRGFELRVGANAQLVIHDRTPEVSAVGAGHTAVDPILLEIFNNMFMSIATQMGSTLRRTALSTNIRERLDFSCAVFDRNGGLVANAPHIPVHLGAMSESIKGILAAYPAPRPGWVFATNDPAAGGSHLPDITVITPIHDGNGELICFTASRGLDAGYNCA